LTFKIKNILLECAVYQSPKLPKSLIVIIKHSTGSHLWKSKCACLPNYQHLPRKNVNKWGGSSDNEPSRKQSVNF